MDESPDKPSGESSPAPMPLNYQSWTDQIEPLGFETVVGMIIAFTIWFFVAFAESFMMSLVLFDPHAAPIQHARFRVSSVIAVCVYSVLMVGLLVVFVRAIRKPGWRTVRRWALFGALLGVVSSLAASVFVIALN